MNTEHSGRESIESLDQGGHAQEKKPETTITQDEVAAGEEADVPGGAYNVPPELAEELSDEEAVHDQGPDAGR